MVFQIKSSTSTVCCTDNSAHLSIQFKYSAQKARDFYIRQYRSDFSSFLFTMSDLFIRQWSLGGLHLKESLIFKILDERHFESAQELFRSFTLC